jgi:tagaturonate reductase
MAGKIIENRIPGMAETGIIKISIMQLSGKILHHLHTEQATIPGDALLVLPEKVLQFGTGVLLRGLPDYFIDKANKKNIFNGRVVVVKSTNTGGTDAFKEQDGLFTILERGVEGGIRSQKTVINAAISRVLSATEEWDAILQCAADPAMQVIISNTTEVGIALVEADAYAAIPVSFPGRILFFLEARYEAFSGNNDAGMVIIPTELIPENGTLLKHIVIKLAELKGLDDNFIHWLENANDFCNSLVDRIVPGKLSVKEQVAAQQQLGYEDKLMIMSECYRLWAIETTSERTRAILSFSKADAGIVLAPDINKFRELKLRLLNGTHTFSCGLAWLAGFTTVKEAMNDEWFATYLSNLMLQEIVPLVAKDDISLEEANDFAMQVTDRFKNPYIEHAWLSITVQYTSKMMLRTVPLVENHYALTDEVPECMALGFAAFILFMHSVKKSGDNYFGEYNGITYPIQDDKAELLYAAWQENNTGAVTDIILRSVFNTDLTRFKGFAGAVNSYLASLMEKGADKTLRSGVIKKSVA